MLKNKNKTLNLKNRVTKYQDKLVKINYLINYLLLSVCTDSFKIPILRVSYSEKS